MSYRLTTEYRNRIEDFLNELIESCEKCEDTYDIRHYAEALLLKLEEYSQKH